jgi:GntR family transcriptional regulator
MIGVNREISSVDRKTAVPLYHQIFLQLRDDIVSGARAFGSSVPTEQELSESFGVSRITARRALDELALQHLVERKRRVGTRVIYNLPVRPIVADIGKAVDSLVTFGRKTKVTVLEITREEVHDPVASLLGVKPGTRVVRAVRLRWLDGEPLGCTIAHVPENLGFMITEKSLKEVPIVSLVQQSGRKFGGAAQTIAAVSADSAMAAALKIDSMAPLLRITRAFHDEDGGPMLLTQAYYRADRYQMRFDLQSSTIQAEV